jgi:hypothetical protein
MVLEGFDIVKEAGAPHKAVMREFRGVRISRNLEIDLVPSEETISSMSQAPVLCGVEVLRAQS